MPLRKVLEITSVADTVTRNSWRITERPYYSRLSKTGLKPQVRRIRTKHSTLQDLVLSRSVLEGRVFFMTLGDPDRDPILLGLGPKDIKKDGEVWMLRGGKVLYVLRPVPNMKRCFTHLVRELNDRQLESKHQTTEHPFYRFLGEAFMLGLMDGEVAEMMGLHPNKLKRERAQPLKDMAEHFTHILLI